jgi:hypothetical protein
MDLEPQFPTPSLVLHFGFSRLARLPFSILLPFIHLAQVGFASISQVRMDVHLFFPSLTLFCTFRYFSNHVCRIHQVFRLLSSVLGLGRQTSIL